MKKAHEVRRVKSPDEKSFRMMIIGEMNNKCMKYVFISDVLLHTL